MNEKCCRNCFYFKDEMIDGYPKYSCILHELYNDEVSHPDSQFCGDENWQSKNRIENLNKLGI